MTFSRSQSIQTLMLTEILLFKDQFKSLIILLMYYYAIQQKFKLENIDVHIHL